MEFALVVPILLLMILGLVDFARAWNVYQVLTDAAREGARYCAVDNGYTEQQVIDDIVIPALERGRLNGPVTIAAPGCEDVRPDPVTVQIDYDYTLNWVGIFLELVTGDPTLTLSTQFTMRNE